MSAQVVDAVQHALGVKATRAPTRDRPLPRSEPTTSDGAEISPGLPYRMSDMRWSVENELACTLGDLLIRRTHLAYETRDNGRAAARRVAAFLGWSAAEVERYDAEASRIFGIDP